MNNILPDLQSIISIASEEGLEEAEPLAEALLETHPNVSWNDIIPCLGRIVATRAGQEVTVDALLEVIEILVTALPEEEKEGDDDDLSSFIEQDDSPSPKRNRQDDDYVPLSADQRKHIRALKPLKCKLTRAEDKTALDALFDLERDDSTTAEQIQPLLFVLSQSVKEWPEKFQEIFEKLN